LLYTLFLLGENKAAGHLDCGNFVIATKNVDRLFSPEMVAQSFNPILNFSVRLEAVPQFTNYSHRRPYADKEKNDFVGRSNTSVIERSSAEDERKVRWVSNSAINYPLLELISGTFNSSTWSAS
jgi:hypothetical protein